MFAKQTPDVAKPAQWCSAEPIQSPAERLDRSVALPVGSPATARRAGYSRTDMVFLMVVGGALVSVLIVGLARLQRQPERLPWDANHLRHVALACHSFSDWRNGLPPAFDKFQGVPFAASMHVNLLPFVELDPLYQKYLQAGKVDDDVVVRYFVASLDPTLKEDGKAVQNFAANLRVFSDKGRDTHFEADMRALAEIEPGTARMPDSFEDGTSNTIIFSTKYSNCGDGGSRFAAAPNSPFAAFFGENAARRPAHPFGEGVTFQSLPSRRDCRPSPLTAQSYLQRGLLVALADGSVRYISPSISPQIWNRLLQPNDGMGHVRDWGD